MGKPEDAATSFVLSPVNASNASIRLRPGFRSGPQWGTLQRSSRPQLSLRRGMGKLNGKGWDGKGTEVEGNKEKGKEKEERGRVTEFGGNLGTGKGRRNRKG